MSEINKRSIEEDKQPPRLESRKLIGNRVCAEVIGHAEIEDGQGISLDTAGGNYTIAFRNAIYECQRSPATASSRS